MRNPTEAGTDGTMSSVARLEWSAPTLRLLPIQESEGSHFSPAAIDGVSSS